MDCLNCHNPQTARGEQILHFFHTTIDFEYPFYNLSQKRALFPSIMTVGSQHLLCRNSAFKQTSVHNPYNFNTCRNSAFKQTAVHIIVYADNFNTCRSSAFKQTAVHITIMRIISTHAGILLSKRLLYLL